MERCFIINKDTRLYKAYKKYEDNSKANNEIIKKFMSDNGIESNLYCCISSNVFAIVPTDADRRKFGANLTKKEYGQGLRAFNKRSKISKAYEKLNLPVVYKPTLWHYVNFMRAGTRLFMLDDVLYATLEGEEITPTTEFPDGWEEIKRSEFYAILEEL